MERIPHSASTVRPEHLRYLREAVERNHVGRGPLSQRLCEALAAHCGREAAVLADSGEAALALALAHLHAQQPQRDEVLVCAYVCPAVVNAILARGLRPVFADNAPGSLNLDVADAARRLSARSLAIVCTHVGGYPDDIAAALRLGVPVVSDCAQGLGATVDGQPVTALGALTVLSFGSTKFLTAGLGGAVLGSAADAQALARLSSPELPVADYRAGGFVPTLGQHFGDLNAALALAQLEDFDAFRRARLEIAADYDAVLRHVPGVQLPVLPPGGAGNGFRYYFLSDRAAAWAGKLQAAGIDARTSIAHVMTDYFADSGSRPALARNAGRVVSLPIYPALQESQRERIVRALREPA